MGDVFGRLKTSVVQFASSLHDALELSSEQNLWDRCVEQSIISSSAFADADLSVLEWEMGDEQLLPASQHTVEEVQRLETDWEASAGYLAGADRCVKSISTTLVLCKTARSLTFLLPNERGLTVFK
jgi:hypothetical protein